MTLLKKYFVVFPSSGLADMLSVIERCLQYAIANDRLLIIDTSQEVVNSWFMEDIGHFFHFDHPNVYHAYNAYNAYNANNAYNDYNDYPSSTKSILESLQSLSIFPDAMTLVPIKKFYYFMDLTKDYSEDVIVHSSGGFSGIPEFLLSSMHITPMVSKIYHQRRSLLPEKYTSVHIRNTDKISDVPSFLKKHHRVLSEKVIFLASDHYDTIQHIKQQKVLYPHVHTFSNIPNNQGNNIHSHLKLADRRESIVDCIVDLLLLASADSFLYPHLKSGYTRIAKYLFDNKSILHQILTIRE